MTIEEIKHEIVRMLGFIHSAEQLKWIYSVVCASYEKLSLIHI